MLEITNLSFFNKEPTKALITCNLLLNKYIKDISTGNLFVYKRQRNFVFVKRITDNRKLWQYIKPNFTDKTLKDEGIALADGTRLKQTKKV